MIYGEIVKLLQHGTCVIRPDFRRDTGDSTKSLLAVKEAIIVIISTIYIEATVLRYVSKVFVLTTTYTPIC